MKSKEYSNNCLYGVVAELNDMFGNRQEQFLMKPVDVIEANLWLAPLISPLIDLDNWLIVHEYGGRVRTQIHIGETEATIVILYPPELPAAKLQELELPRSFHFELKGDHFVWVRTFTFTSSEVEPFSR